MLFSTFKKKLKTLFISVFAGTILLINLSAGFPVRAAIPAQYPIEKAAVYTVFWYLRACSEIVKRTQWNDSDRSLQEMSDGKVFEMTGGVITFSGDDFTRSGYLLGNKFGVQTSSNGSIDCRQNTTSVGDAIKAIGLDPVEFFVDAGTHETSPGGWSLVGGLSNGERTDLLKAELQRQFPNIDFDSDMTPSMQYYQLIESFRAKCSRGDGTGGAGVDIPFVQADGSIKLTRTIVNTSTDDKHAVGYGISNNQDDSQVSGGLQNCERIIENLGPASLAASAEVTSLIASGVSPPDVGVDGGNPVVGAAPQNQPSCESSGGVFSFIICPLVSWLDEGIAWADDRILNMLSVNEAYYSEDENPGVKQAWGTIRNVAYILLVPIMLVMVISTALGFSFVDAYTVKRALPRMLVAIIFMALSFDIAVILIEVSNQVGKSVGGLIAAPFGGVDQLQLSNIFRAPEGLGDNALYTGVLAAVGIYLLSPVTLGFMGSLLLVGLLTLFVAFALLVFREMLIIFLMILGPLAILSWIFPGNDKLWKLWWNSFSKLLLLFPIIAAVLITGRVFAFIVDGTPTEENAVIITIIKLIAFIGPYFFIPKAFQLAGSAFSNLAGMAQNRERGILESQRKKRAAMYDEARQKNKNFSRFSNNNAFGRSANTLLGGSSNLGSLVKKGGLQEKRFAGQTVQAESDLKNDSVYMANQNDDNFQIALANRGLAERKLAAARVKLANASSAEERDKAQAEINAREKGLNAANQVKSRNTAGTQRAALNAWMKSGYNISEGEEGYNEIAETARAVSGGDSRAYSAIMNEAQYHAKSAGHAHLGGINNGNGYDPGSGIKKAGLYGLASGKTEAIKAWGETADVSGTGPLTEDHLVHYKELEAMKSNATGANRDEIVKQMEQLERRGVKAAGAMSSGRVDGMGNPIMKYETLDARRASIDIDYRNRYGITSAEITAGMASGGSITRMTEETLDDVASAKARKYESYDPNKEK